MKKLLISLCFFSGVTLFAQTKVTPDCTIPFSFTAAGSTSSSTCGSPNGAPNGNGIASWIVVYYATGFSGLSVTVQSAPDSAGTPGSWGTFAGTVLTSVQYPGSSGANPNTAITSAFTGFAGYYPWMRVNVSGLTGSGKITGNLYGFYNSTLAKAGSGGGGGITVAGTANQIAISPSDPCSSGTCTISVPTNPVFNGTVTGGGFISNEAASGNLQLNGLTSGNVTLAVNDIAGTAIAYVWPATNGTTGQVLEDTGSATCPTLPAGAPTNCHQLAWTTGGGGGSAGGGVLGYSGSALTLPTAGTTFLAPVGGALASATEANVTANAPAAAAISNMYVSMSAAPGTGNSIAFTFRDAGSSTALTCTISGATATSCQDITHSFTPTVGDALSIQVVTTGTVIIAPTIRILAEYGVTGGGGGTPGGSFSEYQYRAGSSTFGAVTNTGPVPVTGWTALNFGGQAAINDFDASTIQLGIGNNASFALRNYCRTLPSPPYSAIVTLDVEAWRNFGGTEGGFLFLSDGTKYEGIGVVFQPSGGAMASVNVLVATNASTFGSYLATGTPFFLSHVTFKVSDDGSTNRVWSYWSSGGFVTLLSEATGSFLTPSSFCFGGFINDQIVANDPNITIALKYLCSASATTCNGN